MDIVSLIERVQAHATDGAISLDFGGDYWEVTVYQRLDDPDGYIEWTRKITSDITYRSLDHALAGTLHYLETGSDDYDPEQAAQPL